MKFSVVLVINTPYNNYRMCLKLTYCLHNHWTDCPLGRISFFLLDTATTPIMDTIPWRPSFALQYLSHEWGGTLMYAEGWWEMEQNYMIIIWWNGEDIQYKYTCSGHKATSSSSSSISRTLRDQLIKTNVDILLLGIYLAFYNNHGSMAQLFDDGEQEDTLPTLNITVWGRGKYKRRFSIRNTISILNTNTCNLHLLHYITLPQSITVHCNSLFIGNNYWVCHGQSTG